jgi:hypothetical protein
MNERLRNKLEGLRNPLTDFSTMLFNPTAGTSNLHLLNETIMKEMKSLNFDKIMSDEVGNIIGIIEGYRKQEDVVILCNIDLSRESDEKELSSYDTSANESYKMGIITSLFTAALLKRSIAALSGDLIVCCVPRQQCCDFGIQYLFDHFLKNRKIKGIVLAEPTNFNINLGNKGRMEYEIIVEGYLNDGNVQASGYGMLNSMFPLIRELEDVSKRLPKNCELGNSILTIKDISCSESLVDRAKKEFRVLVDRVFVPEETSQAIIERARDIATNIYQDRPSTTVSAVMTRNKVKTILGKQLELRNQYEPWKMDSHNRFAFDSLEVLRENGIQAGIGYWKKIITEGSYTFGKLGIPTIGFGAGIEDEPLILNHNVRIDDLEKSCFGKALIIYRNIGLPTFGWSDDEI